MGYLLSLKIPNTVKEHSASHTADDRPVLEEVERHDRESGVLNLPVYEDGNKEDTNDKHNDDICMIPSRSSSTSDGHWQEDQGKDSTNKDQSNEVKTPEEVDGESTV